MLGDRVAEIYEVQRVPPRNCLFPAGGLVKYVRILSHIDPALPADK